MALQNQHLFTLTASEVQRLISSGSLTLEGYVSSLIARYRERDEHVNAWACIEPERVLEEARQLDQELPEKRGRLHGFVIGVKDVMTTKGELRGCVADLPTRYNSPLHEHDGPLLDASSVAILRQNGALIMGKTRTTEFAATTNGPGTKNAHDPTRSPGGSSSGSSAGVADMQIPIGLGTQTVGSIIRPASFNGVYGFKPTWNAISTEGQKVFSPTLDTFGFMARCVADLQALADVFALRDDQPVLPISLNGAKFAMVKTYVWPRAGPNTIIAMKWAARILEEAGATVEHVTLPPEFMSALALQDKVLRHEAGVSFLGEYTAKRGQISDMLADFASTVHSGSRQAFLAAADRLAALRPKIDAIANKYTAIITPSVVDQAPLGIEWTGSSDFNGIWTALHTPVINIPGFKGVDGLPIGLSVVAARYRDQHLLQVARELGPFFAARGDWQGQLFPGFWAKL